MITLWKRFWHFIAVKSAIKQANKMKLLTGKKHYVIMLHRKIMVYDRVQINYLIDAKVLNKRLKEAHNLNKISIYYTK